MKVLKSLVPIFILIFGSFYFYRNYHELPISVINGITLLPQLLAIMVVGLSFHFNRSIIFFYAGLTVMLNLSLRFGWADSDRDLAVLSTFLPVLFVVLTLLPDRGILTVRAIPAYLVVILVVAPALFVINNAPAPVVHALLGDWLPSQYFDWTRLSQTGLAIAISTLFILFLRCILFPSPHTAAGFGVLLMFIAQLHFGATSHSLSAFSSVALLMCLYAVMQESWRMAYLDELTGLPSRRALREKFQKIGGVYTVAMLDVDHFKKFNDRYGHDTGDAVLRMIAAKMKQVSGGGVPYRYGGEEFAVVFTGKQAGESKAHLDALRELIACSPFVINRMNRRQNDKSIKTQKRKSVTVTVSIGVADSAGQTSTPWEVLKQADKALYRAKDQGRNCVCE